MRLQYPFLIFNAAHYGFKFSHSRPRHARCPLIILGSSDDHNGDSEETQAYRKRSAESSSIQLDS